MPSLREMVRERMRRTGEDEATAAAAVAADLGADNAKNAVGTRPDKDDDGFDSSGIDDVHIHHRPRKNASARRRSATLPSWAIPVISIAGGLGGLVLIVMLLVWILRASLT
jgi:hypothetical protein